MPCYFLKASLEQICASGNREAGEHLYCDNQQANGQALENAPNDWIVEFEPKSDAPPRCQGVFTGAQNEASGSAVDGGQEARDSCVKAVETVSQVCDWTGGEIQDDCGTYRWFSCSAQPDKCFKV